MPSSEFAPDSSRSRSDGASLVFADVLQRALAHHRAGQLAEAARLYREVIRLQPDHFDALHWLGLVETRQGNFEDALRLLGAAIGANPQSAEAFANRAVVLKALGRTEDALASCERALALNARHVEALYNRGVVLAALGRKGEALESYAQALALKPDVVQAMNNAGAVLATLNRYDDALASYDKALAIAPDFGEALYNRGLALAYLGRHTEAARDFARALQLDSSLPFVQGMLAHSQMHVADWGSIDVMTSSLVVRVRNCEPASDPLTLMGLADSAADQRLCAETWVRHKCGPAAAALWSGERYAHERIRLGYLSADFREHPVARLMVDLFERHDRRRFETIALSLGSAAPDAMRTRLSGAFDRFIDVARTDDRELAALMRSLEIDIAVDLMGFTADARPGVLALRPCPVQVNYLGYPGTMGARYIDYVLADRFVIPVARRTDYAEHVVYLPDTFQANTATRPAGQHVPSRAEAGLPERGFVFCSFNNTYKITPGIFDVWMRLLLRIDGSVLWLVGGDGVVETNLRREAKRRGVERHRLVFAQRAPYAEHLARQRLADLFLDTLPFNAGATASDAIGSGLPVLTCAGDAFAARMGMSLLNAAGLPDLVTESLHDYEALAVRIASESALHSTLRRKLAANRERMPLFDSDRFRRHIEAAYVTMWTRCEAGESPASFAVEPIDDFNEDVHRPA